MSSSMPPFPFTETVFLSIGSNRGKPLDNCRKSIDFLQEFDGIVLVSLSSLYLTEPVSEIVQSWFVNAVVGINFAGGPEELLDLCQNIELRLGRTRHQRNEARVIDIDLVFFGQHIINSKELIIPHPRWRERKFVLVPLDEIAPDFIDPVSRLSVRRALQMTDDKHAVVPYEKQWYCDTI